MGGRQALLSFAPILQSGTAISSPGIKKLEMGSPGARRHGQTGKRETANVEVAAAGAAGAPPGPREEQGGAAGTRTTVPCPCSWAKCGLQCFNEVVADSF